MLQTGCAHALRLAFGACYNHLYRFYIWLSTVRATARPRADDRDSNYSAEESSDHALGGCSRCVWVLCLCSLCFSSSSMIPVSITRGQDHSRPCRARSTQGAVNRGSVIAPPSVAYEAALQTKSRLPAVAGHSLVCSLGRTAVGSTNHQSKFGGGYHEDLRRESTFRCN